MKKKILLFFMFLIPLASSAQFDQKISINFNAGIFKTFGKKVGEYEPMQMPNYGMGFSANGGVQFKISERFSLAAEFGMMSSHKWDYHEGDNNSYLYWSINNATSGELLEEGYDYLDIHNYSIGIKPVFYLLKDKKLNPYIYSGINVNLTNAWFENNLWTALKKWDMLPPDDTGPYNGNLEKNFGIGFNPGLGLEYKPGSRMSVYLSSGYSFIKLNKKNFKSPSREENFNAFVLQAGLRIAFIKTKDL